MQPTPAPGIVLQSCSGRQFAAAYGITYKVFRRLLKENNLYYKRTAKKFTLLEVVQITAKLGMPTRPLVKEDL